MAIPKFVLTLILVLTFAFSLSCDVCKTVEAGSKDAGKAGLEKKIRKVPVMRRQEEEHEGIVRISKESHDILGIETVKVTPQTPEKYVRATAEIQFNANRVFHIGPRVPSRVVAVFADLGDEVEKGQKLALLDSVELGNAVADYLTDKTRMSVRKAHFEREKMLWEKKVSSEREMLDAKSAFLQAKAAYEAAENKLHLFGLKEEDILTLKSETHSITAFPLLSPFSGTVVQKHIALGEMQDTSAQLFTIADLQVLWIILDIYEKDLAKISTGQRVKVSVSAYPDTYFHGQITYISDVMDERTRTVKVRVEIDNSERKLKPGMFATAKISTREAIPGHERLIIPSSAIESYEGDKVIFMALGNYSYKMEEVQVGKEFDGQVEVLGGLNEGDEVVTKGSFYLKSE
ncbi:MAG: efflux RND transporter periplasmic adaptor subunit, partial [Candidatus Brocadiales bacterium]